MSFKNFALPIGHSPLVLSTVTFTLGLPFRQTVSHPDSSNFSKGIDLFFSENDDKSLYSMFDGTLEYYPSTYVTKSDYTNSLVLTLLSNISPTLKRIPKLKEPIPSKIIYQNINLPKIKEKLSSLILYNFNNKTTHPILNSIYKTKTIKQYLIGKNATTEIETIVGLFLTNHLQLFVSAGDLLGEAGVATIILGGNNYHSTIIFEIYDGTYLNPKYYLWLFLKDIVEMETKNNKRIQCITNTGKSGNIFDHPLLNSTGLNIDLSVNNDVSLLPRRPITINDKQTILFPISNLSLYHGHERSESKSKLLWQITNDDNLIFNVILRNSASNSIGNKVLRLSNLQFDATTMIDVCPDPNDSNGNPDYIFYPTKVTNNIIPLLDDINSICYELQFPAEIIISAIYHESNGNNRALRIEKLNPSAKKALVTHFGANSTLISNYEDLAPHGNLTVPDGVNINTTTKVVGGFELSWGELLQIIAVDGSRMSPGLVQQLISTAKNEIYIKYLKKWYSDTELEDIFHVTDLPSTNLEFFYWMLNSKNSILLATVYHKMLYLVKETKLDLINQSARYNFTNPTVKSYPPYKSETPWLIPINDSRYIIEASKCFNYIQNNRTTIQLTSRFNKSL